MQRASSQHTQRAGGYIATPLSLSTVQICNFNPSSLNAGSGLEHRQQGVGLGGEGGAIGGEVCCQGVGQVVCQVVKGALHTPNSCILSTNSEQLPSKSAPLSILRQAPSANLTQADPQEIHDSVDSLDID